MRITRRQFELGVTPAIEEMMRVIYAFLTRHGDEAFPEDELWRSVYQDLTRRVVVDEVGEQPREKPSPEYNRRFLRALSALAELGAIDKREVTGTVYYAFSSEVDPHTWAPQKE